MYVYKLASLARANYLIASLINTAGSSRCVNKLEHTHTLTEVTHLFTSITFYPLANCSHPPQLETMQPERTFYFATLRKSWNFSRSKELRKYSLFNSPTELRKLINLA